MAVLIVPTHNGYKVEIRDKEAISVVAVINKNHIRHDITAIDIADIVRDGVDEFLRKNSAIGGRTKESLVSA